MRNIFLLLFVTASSLLYGQTEVIKLSDAKNSDQGLAYSLPKTVVHINLVSYKCTRTVGPYYKYADRYLGVKDPIVENNVEWILENVDLENVAVADLDNSYLVLFKSTPAPSIDLTKDGIMRAINMEYTSDSDAKVVQAAKIVDADNSDVKMKVMSEEQLMAASTAKMAETAAKQIYKIRESRTDLVTGNMDKLPADGESFKLMLKQLDDQEKALTALFVGTEVKERKVITIDLNPTEDAEKELVGRFSKFNGAVDKNDLAGAPIYVNIKTLEKREVQEDPKASKAKRGIFYRVPAKVQFTVSTLGNKVLAKETFQVAQMGTVVSLSPNLFENKKQPVRVLFDPLTGAIRQMNQ